jgi:hypothetical protein
MVGAGALGARLGSSLATLTGHGDYNVVANSLINRGPSSTAGLLFDKRGRRGTRFVRREFIGNIISSTGFVNRSYPINPGLASTCPWFSSIAANYDEWVPNGICFEFKSFLADFNGTNATLGSAVGAFEYDSLDPPFATKVEMEASVGAQSLRGNQDGLFGAECARSERTAPTLYTRTGSVPIGGTISNYDLGTFQFATSNFSNNTDIAGELWIIYDVTLFKEQLAGGQVGNDVSAVTIIGASTVGSAAPLGNLSSLPNVQQFGTLRMGYIQTGTASPDQLTFPSYIGTGSYRVLFQWFGTVANTITLPTLTGTNATRINALGSPSNVSAIIGSNVTGSQIVTTYDTVWTITANNAAINIAHDGTFPIGTSGVTVFIIQMPTTVPQALLGTGSLPS